MTAFVPSRYNIVVPLRNGRALAYNSASGATALLERDEITVLQHGADDDQPGQKQVVRNLVYGGFLTHRGADELELLQTEYKRQRFDPSGMILTIAPTLACNFGCDYCFQGADKPKGKMSQDVQDAVIQFFLRLARGIRRLHIAWYGGEPLLAREVVERLSDRVIQACRDAAIAYDAMIVTNGYGLTPDVARSLYGRFVSVAQVTLDGAADYHDRRRTLLSGRGTFDRIIGNLRRVVDETQLRVVVRINIDSRNSSGVIALLEDLAAQGFSGRKNFGVYFAPVEAITDGCHCVVSVCMTKKGYAQIETTLHRRAYDLGLAPLPYPRRFRGLCAALRPNSFVVLPNGDLHKCWDTVSMGRMKVGSVFTPELLASDERAQVWNNWTPFENQTCRSCKILPICAGSCAHKFINPDQTSGEAGSLPCPPWKYQMKERLVMLAKERGIIQQDDYDVDQIATDPLEICSVPPPESMVVVGQQASYSTYDAHA